MSPRRTWYPHNQQLAAWRLTAEPRTLRASSRSPHTAFEPTLLALDPKPELTPTPKTQITSPCPTPSPGNSRRNPVLLGIRMHRECCCCSSCCCCCCCMLPFVIVHPPPEVVLHANSSTLYLSRPLRACAEPQAGVISRGPSPVYLVLKKNDKRQL